MLMPFARIVCTLALTTLALASLGSPPPASGRAASSPNPVERYTVALPLLQIYRQPRVVFHSGFYLWVVNADGGGLRKLREDQAALARPAPDGRHVAISTSTTDFDMIGPAKLTLHSMVTGADTEPFPLNYLDYGSWSPDGSMFAYYYITDGGGPRPTKGTVTVLSAAGDVLWQFDNLEYPGGVAWAPDSRRLAIAYRNIREFTAILDVETGARVDLSAGGRAPLWSRDGTRIFFARDFSGQTDLFAINQDGSGLTNLTATPDAIEAFAQLSPDGARMLYASRVVDSTGRPFDLYMMDLASGAATRLTISEQNGKSGPGASMPRWSPDGSRFAYIWSPIGDRTGPWLYVANADGSGTHQIAIPKAESFSWSLDGTQIALEAFPQVFVVDADSTGRTTLLSAHCYSCRPVWLP